MAIPEDDRVIRRTDGFRDNTNMTMAMFAAAIFFLGLIVLYTAIRADAPTSGQVNPTKAPVTSTSPTPATIPSRP